MRRPRDKASAEKGVQVVETRVLAALRNRVFFTLDEANAAIREMLTAVNARPLTTDRTLTRPPRQTRNIPFFAIYFASSIMVFNSSGMGTMGRFSTRIAPSLPR